jgi:hypothetical protein
MKLHADELRLARAWDVVNQFERLSQEQITAIQERGRTLFRWFKLHPRLHNVISASVILFLLAGDAFALLVLPRWFFNSTEPGVGWVVLASVICGSLHGWMLYSLSVLSLHEGAAHNMIFAGKGRMARAGQFLARNACRIAQCEPNYYAECHFAHHRRFATEHDSEFLNFVSPHRFWLSILPFAAFVNSTDFVAHRPPSFTRARLITSATSLAYQGVYIYFMYRFFGLLFTLIVTLVFTAHAGFYLDRMRQYLEHNLMPLENSNGARSLGVGFWGMLVGGGPWGQPCHWAHHLVPNIPWYHQIMLDRYIRRLLTPKQREQFLVKPFIGFPLLLWRVIRDAGSFSRSHQIPAARPEPVPERRTL